MLNGLTGCNYSWPLYPQVPNLQIKPTAEQKYIFFLIPENSKKQNILIFHTQ